jgi:twinkle protein
MNESKFVKHRQPCPSCNGSDPVSINEDGSAKCFSCGTFFTDYKNPNGVTQINIAPKLEKTFFDSYRGTFGALTDRGISEEVSKKYGVRVVYHKDGSVAEHIYPYYNGNEIAGTKTRYVNNKNFKMTGTFNGTGLFGEQLYKKGGKYLTITEGECDALAVAELGIRTAVVSIKRGSASAVRDVRESIEFIESFEQVVIAFDNDKAGRTAAREVASILKPGKARILKLTDGYKDPNDMLKGKKFTEFTKAWFEAKVYTPSGILELSSRKDKWLTREVKQSIAFPYAGLNKKLYGLSQVMEWYKTPQVQAYAQQGYMLKWGSKVQEAKETKYGADSEQVICLYMVKPYKPNDVDGFKKVQVPPVQPMPQAIQQSQVSVEVDKEMDDDLPPF